MLVLPNTPPLPVGANLDAKTFASQLIGVRSQLINYDIDNYGDSIRYVINVENYLDQLIKNTSQQLNDKTIEAMIEHSANCVIAKVIPWKGIKIGGSKRKIFKSLKLEIDWKLIDEIVATVISICFIYVKIAAELVNDLIDSEVGSETIDKWKQVINFYKIAISFSLFGQKIVNESSFDSFSFTTITKIIDISIQMSILSKSSWINQDSYKNSESFKTTNNGTLARVAIFIVDELKNLQSLVNLTTNDITVDLTNWLDYLSIVEKYNLAYAGQFLSIEYYQQNKLGQAIGLVEFSLLSLQTKSIGDTTSRFGKVINKVKTKRNENILSKLDSVTTLKIDKTIFAEKSGIVLNDISYLFDLLVQLHLKYTKENSTLVFDQIVNWKDIKKDSKWPTGCQIPVTSVNPFNPFASNVSKAVTNSGREGYY